MSRTVVIKFGGHAMDKEALCAAFAEDLAFLSAEGTRCVVVHGGGPQISALLERLHIESRFENGLRVTDEATMQAVEMVLCGQVNKDVVRRFAAHGVRAAGISGRDGGLLLASVRQPALGRVGEVDKVDPAFYEQIKDGDMVAVNADEGYVEILD